VERLLGNNYVIPRLANSLMFLPLRMFQLLVYLCLTGEWRKLHNEELRDLYSLPIIVRVVKSRRMRWAGHVADPAGRTMALGLTQPLTEMSTRSISWR
jgi:hypothetical protein